MIYPKTVNFDHTEAGLTSKWGKIWPAVQWCYQNQFNSNIRRHTTSSDVAQKFVIQALSHVYGLYSKVALTKNVIVRLGVDFVLPLS